MKYNIEEYCNHFRKLLESQLLRCERMEKESGRCDFSKKEKIIIGVIGGDGIGPIIVDVAKKVTEKLLCEEISRGKVEIRVIEGLTIENRVAVMKAIPDDVLTELKECHP